MISFTTYKKPVLDVLRHMKAGLKSNSKDADRIFCEVTIMKGNVKFAGNGYTHHLECITEGVAKFSIHIAKLQFWTELSLHPQFLQNY